MRRGDKKEGRKDVWIGEERSKGRKGVDRRDHIPERL